MADSSSFEGRPEHFAAWQAIHQAIGFLKARSGPAESLVPGLMSAAEVLNAIEACPGCDRRGLSVRQKEDGSLTCLACGRMVSPPEVPDGR